MIEKSKENQAFHDNVFNKLLLSIREKTMKYLL